MSDAPTKMIDLDQVCALLGHVSQATAKYTLRKYKVPSIWRGRNRRWRRSDIEKLVSDELWRDDQTAASMPEKTKVAKSSAGSPRLRLAAKTSDDSLLTAKPPRDI